jgi:hypothetical protein
MPIMTQFNAQAARMGPIRRTQIHARNKDNGASLRTETGAQSSPCQRRSLAPRRFLLGAGL